MPQSQSLIEPIQLLLNNFDNQNKIINEQKNSFYYINRFFNKQENQGSSYPQPSEGGGEEEKYITENKNELDLLDQRLTDLIEGKTNLINQLEENFKKNADSSSSIGLGGRELESLNSIMENIKALLEIRGKIIVSIDEKHQVSQQAHKKCWSIFPYRPSEDKDKLANQQLQKLLDDIQNRISAPKKVQNDSPRPPDLSLLTNEISTNLAEDNLLDDWVVIEGTPDSSFSPGSPTAASSLQGLSRSPFGYFYSR